MNKNVRLTVLLRGRVLACLGFKTQPGRVGVAVAIPEDSQPGMVDDKIQSSWEAEAGSSFCSVFIIFIFENGCLVAQA